MKHFFLSIIVLFTFLIAKSQADNNTQPNVDLNNPPHRIIRACCAFGANMKLVGLPFIKINHITSVADLGQHKYMSGKNEGNGVIYTQNGGFIDIGHLRDQADWTYYLYHYILDARGKGEVVQKLGNEAGRKKLKITVPTDFDSTNCLLLAGKITYDLSLWHELSTWFGASTIPMMPERYSSFSVEDVYSNLLGVLIGIEAIESKLPFNEAVSNILIKTMAELIAVETEEETYTALEEVKNIWWTNEKRIPNKKVLLEYDTDAYAVCTPWLIPNTKTSNSNPITLDVPLTTISGQMLNYYYELSINLNNKLPIEDIFPNRDTKTITQCDFEKILNWISKNS